MVVQSIKQYIEVPTSRLLVVTAVQWPNGYLGLLLALTYREVLGSTGQNNSFFKAF